MNDAGMLLPRDLSTQTHSALSADWVFSWSPAAKIQMTQIPVVVGLIVAPHGLASA